MSAARNNSPLGTLAVLAVSLLTAWAGETPAQTFASGSSGALGAFNPSANTVVPLPPDGVLNYTTVTIPAGVTVTFQPNVTNTPVTLLASGDVTINGTISVNGFNGANGVCSTSAVPQGGAGGPGGFRGGNGRLQGAFDATDGQGPGRGPKYSNGAQYGASGAFVTLLPLFGGSGGSGAFTGGTGCSADSGGGGGGAIVIASSTKIVLGGSITANGGVGGCNIGGGGPGSGGAIRVVANQISGSGLVQAAGQNSCGRSSGAGRIRVEAFNSSFTGTLSPQLGGGATQSTPGPVTAASNPSLVALPTLTIASIGGIAVPPSAAGSYAQGDVSLPQGTSNPVPVVINATNTPLAAQVTVIAMPRSADTITSALLTLSGTFASSSLTTNVTLPVGVSVLQAWATMTLTGQVASLFPAIDGEPVERVAVAATEGGASALSLITRSGKEKRLDQLDVADQLRVAQAWEALKATRAQ